MECTLEAFPRQDLMDLSCVVLQTHTEKRSKTQLLVDWNVLGGIGLLATLFLKIKSVNVEGRSYI